METKGDRTKVKILDALSTLIRDQGFYGVSLSRVAQEAALSHAAIYNHYRDLDAVFTAAAERALALAQAYLAERILSSGTAVEMLRSVIEENLRYSSKNKERDGLLLGLTFQALSSPVAQDIYRAVTRTGEERIRIILERGNLDGSWEVADPASKAIIIHDLLLGEIVKLLVLPKERKLADRIELVWHAIEQITVAPNRR